MLPGEDAFSAEPSLIEIGDDARKLILLVTPSVLLGLHLVGFVYKLAYVDLRSVIRQAKVRLQSIWAKQCVSDDPMERWVSSEIHRRQLARARATLLWANRAWAIYCCEGLASAAMRSSLAMSFPQCVIFFCTYASTLFFYNVPHFLSAKTLPWCYVLLMFFLTLQVVPAIAETDDARYFVLGMLILLQLAWGLICPQMKLAAPCNTVLMAVVILGEQSYAVWVHLIDTAVLLVALRCISNWDEIEARRKAEQISHASEYAATQELLNTVCDVVVELDDQLSIVKPAPRLSAMLLHTGNQSLKGQQLQAYMASEEDTAKYLHIMQPLPTGAKSAVQAFHVQMRDASSSNISLEMFAIPFYGLGDVPQFIIGMREFADMPPLIPLTGSSAKNRDFKQASGHDAADAIVKRKKTGTPPESPRESLSDSPAGSETSSNQSTERRLHPGLKLTKHRVKEWAMDKSICGWNIACPGAVCCKYHTLVKDAQRLLKSMHSRPCKSIDTPGWQCNKCGVVDGDMYDADLNLCLACYHVGKRGKATSTAKSQSSQPNPIATSTAESHSSQPNLIVSL